MADPGDSAQSADEQRCTPCRGTGTVISQLGGERSEQTCPWCEGRGRRMPDHDAQARFRQDDAS